MFNLLQHRIIKERDIDASWYRHDCGLQVICLNCNDPENFFAIGFDTVPQNSTGVQHILEHSVLGGSKKYPVKDPFMEIIKTSVASFINAMTFDDHTIYPCVTTNKKDYFNLFNVYWDAVFHPNITRQTFMQEGWHYEIKNDKLVRNGIVLSEMTGYYGQVNNRVEHGRFNNLIPESPRANDSGGDPTKIPALTYRRFLKYYREHYNPAKAKILLYGNIPEEEKLAFIEKHLVEEFHGMTFPVSSTNEGKYDFHKWLKPKKKVITYQPETAEDDSEIVTCSWFIDNTKNPVLDMTMQLLDYILTGNAGSPMHKALMTSGLGTKTMGMGYDGDRLETFFAFGMRGVKNRRDAKKLFALINETLAQVVQDGIPEDMKIGAFRQLQIDNQKIDSESFLDTIEDIFSSWTYDLDPFMFYDYADTVDIVKHKIKENPRYLEETIQKYLIDNPHCLRLEFLADHTISEKRVKHEEEKLAGIFAKMDEKSKQKIKEDSKKLQAFQQRENTTKQLATLPRLSMSDIDPSSFHLPLTQQTLKNDLPLLRGEISGNGLVHAQFAIDLSALPQEFLPGLEIFNTIFSRIGTQFNTYDKRANILNTLGGFITSTVSNGRHYTNIEQNNNTLKFAIMVLEDTLEPTLELLRQEITAKIFTETQRIQQLLKMHWTTLQSSMTHHNNYTLCMTRAQTGLQSDNFNHYREGTTGFSGFFKTKRQMTDLSAEKLSCLLEPVIKIGDWLKDRPLSAVSVVGSDKAVKTISQFVETFNYQPIGIFQPGTTFQPYAQTGRRENFRIGEIHGCVRSFNAPGIEDPRSASLNMLSRMLSEGYLWDNVRVKNGAYGTGAMYIAQNRSMSLFSLDDRRPKETYAIFDDIYKGLVGFQSNHQAIENKIISMAGRQAGRSYKPSMLCDIAMGTIINGFTEEITRNTINSLLTITPKKLLSDAESLYEEFGAVYNDCMIGPEQLPNFKEITK